MRILILASILATALALGPGGGFPGGFPGRGSKGKSGSLADPCTCNVERDDEDGEIFGCCSEKHIPRSLSSVKPAQTKANEVDLKFLNEIQDRDSREAPPGSSIRRLSSAPKAIPFGSYGTDCDEHCVWVRPYCVHIKFSKDVWAKVYQSANFKQWIRYCFCSSYKCHGFFYFYFHWEAKCRRIFNYQSLYVWIPEKKYLGYRVVKVYRLRQKWFRFPSACSCGNPYKFSVKFGGQ